jgi:acyl-coenzyme A synthetase/AMP-(fatty) acid ligase
MIFTSDGLTAVAGVPKILSQQPSTAPVPASTPAPPRQARLLGDLLDAAAERWGHKTAVVSGTRTHSFVQMRDAARLTEAEVRRLGVRRGDRVAVVVDDFPDAIAWMLGVARRGAIYVLLNADTTAYAAEHVLRDSAPVLMLASMDSEARRCASAMGVPVVDVRAFGRAPEMVIETVIDVAGHAEAARPDMQTTPGTPATQATPGTPGPPATQRTPATPATHPDGPISSDIASILYTSGSTGRPKGVTGTHANMVFAVDVIARRLRLRPDDVIGCVMPLAFDYGVYQVLLGLLTGAHLVWGRGAAAGPGLLAFLTDNEVTVLPVVPGLAQNLDRLTRRAHHTLPPLRVLTNTGAAMSVDLRTRLQQAYPDMQVYLMFGLTECKRVSILLPEELPTKAASVGRPLDDTECVIVDGEGRPLPPGEVGELVVRGPHVTLGYWNDPERTAARFRPWGPFGERVLFTGDQCWLDSDGYLYFRGRDDDVYKANGFRVSATEVAMAAEEIDEVEEAYCLPGHGGDAPLLVVVSKLRAHVVRERLARLLEWFKVPDHIVVVERMPLNRNGKVDPDAVRALRPAKSAP